MQINNKTKRILILVGKLLTMFGILFYLFTTISKDISEYNLQEELNILDNTTWGWLILAILLMPLNWFVEIVKWRELIQKVETLSFVNATKGVLTGIAVSAFTPNRTGDFIGRIGYVQQADRIKASLLSIIGNWAQLVNTIVWGSIAIIILMIIGVDFGLSLILKLTISTLLFLSSLFTILFYFNSWILDGIFRRIKILKKYRKYGRVFTLLRGKELRRILLLSALRYCIFVIQYFIILLFFGINDNYLMVLLLIPTVYYSVSLIPSIALYEIGVRETVALFFLSLVTPKETSILIGTFFIWVLNVAIPALAGAGFIIEAKVVKTE